METTSFSAVKDKFGITVDYSDASIAEIETSLNLLWTHTALRKPPRQELEKMSAMFGSYLGETYRRNHGGEWGAAQNHAAALRTSSGIVCYPWGRALKRLTNGPEEEVDGWYQALVAYGRSGPPSLPATSPSCPSNP